MNKPDRHLAMQHAPPVVVLSLEMHDLLGLAGSLFSEASYTRGALPGNAGFIGSINSWFII
jgi:hypothetical protein